MARVWGVGLLIALLAACGGDDSDESTTTTTRAPTTVAVTTTDAPTTTTPAPPTPTPEYSFDGSVPPPPLLNTGTDYAAILNSLRGYVRWLEAHNPDPELLDEVISMGTAEYEEERRDLELLRDNNVRAVWVDYDVDIEVKAPGADSVALRVTDRTTGFRVVEPGGSLQDETVVAPPTFDDALITADIDGRWRIADYRAAPTDDEVVEL